MIRNDPKRGEIWLINFDPKKIFGGLAPSEERFDAEVYTKIRIYPRGAIGGDAPSPSNRLRVGVNI